MGFARALPILRTHASRNDRAEIGAPLAIRRAKHPVKPSAQKHFAFPNFGFVAYSPHPGPAKGAFATVTTCGPGGGGRGSDGAGGVMTGRATVSPHATRTTRRWRAGLSVIGGEHTQALDDFGGTVRGRRSRVVLTPGVCASSLAVMWRPNRARASAIGGATGAIVHRSPGRARRTPLKPSAQGRPGDRPPNRSTPCAFL
ncbi:hypothetical protein ABIB90_005538 [Bradyrhizobium sp. JR4.1]